MWYSFKRINNILTVKKESSSIPVVVSIHIRTPCEGESFEEIYKDVEVKDTYDFTLPKKDSIYKIIINNTISDTEILYPYYDQLLESLIEDISMVLCGCECQNCDDCDEDNEFMISNTLLETMFYYTLTSSIYEKYFKAAFKCLECTFEEINICLLLNKKIKGVSDNKILLKKILSVYYLSFYFSELYSGISDVENLNERYEFNKIKKCISNLGVDISCILTNIEEELYKNKVWFWQSNYIDEKFNFTDIDDNFLKNKTFISLEDALHGYVFIYKNIGQIGFCIENVEPNSIILDDILKKSVNLVFDYHYDQILKRIVFLSKEYISHSDIYLKFNYNEK